MNVICLCERYVLIVLLNSRYFFYLFGKLLVNSNLIFLDICEKIFFLKNVNIGKMMIILIIFFGGGWSLNNSWVEILKVLFLLFVIV